jgi:hypothetical protein
VELELGVWAAPVGAGTMTIQRPLSVRGFAFLWIVTVR